MEDDQYWLDRFPEKMIGKEMTEDKKKNFRHSYTEYETLEEAERHAQRDTARELRSQNIWQRIRETVVPEVDIIIKPVDVKIEAVK